MRRDEPFLEMCYDCYVLQEYTMCNGMPIRFFRFSFPHNTVLVVSLTLRVLIIVKFFLSLAWNPAPVSKPSAIGPSVLPTQPHTVRFDGTHTRVNTRRTRAQIRIQHPERTNTCTHEHRREKRKKKKLEERNEKKGKKMFKFITLDWITTSATLPADVRPRTSPCVSRRASLTAHFAAERPHTQSHKHTPSPSHAATPCCRCSSRCCRRCRRRCYCPFTWTQSARRRFPPPFLSI